MTDEKEQKEIVLGNKQLLSIFFLVVAMMGVAFTIGYMIGRNTAGVTAAVPSTGGQTTATASPVTSSAVPAADNTVPPGTASKPDQSPPPVTAQPGGTQPAKPYESGAAPQSPPRDVPVTETKAASPPAAAGSGSYLQAAAVKREDADHLVVVLRKRGFPALLGESPREGLFRVLVGPYNDMPALADAKQKLRAAGFEPVVAK